MTTGFSDPYCLLSILCEHKESQGGRSSSKPQKAVVRDSAKGQVLQTTIKKQTLNPIWDETLKLWVGISSIERVFDQLFIQLVDWSFCLNACFFLQGIWRHLKCQFPHWDVVREMNLNLLFFRNKKYWLYCTVYFIVCFHSKHHSDVCFIGTKMKRCH